MHKAFVNIKSPLYSELKLWSSKFSTIDKRSRNSITSETKIKILKGVDSGKDEEAVVLTIT